MSDTDVGATDGADSFEADFSAAREADAALGPLPEGDGPQPEPTVEGEAAEKPPLSIDEIHQRLQDQKGATHKERQLRREAEQKAQQLEQRLSKLEQGAGPKPADGEARTRPNPSEDPIGYLEYVEEMLTTGEQKAQEQQEQTAAQQKAQDAMKQVVTQVEQFENDFRETTPDYNDAAEHLYKAKMEEYTEAGYSDADAHTAVMGEFISRSRRALDSGKDPAEIVYNMAKRAGYASKAGDNKLDAIEKGQKRLSPLASGGGGGGGDLTMESVSKLSGAAFDSAFAKLQARAKQIERSSGL